MKKNYVLDTNICLSDANNLFGFADNHVVLTGITMQEINKKKTAGGEVGFQARECARILDELRQKGPLNTEAGINLGNTEDGTLEVLYEDINYAEYLPAGFDCLENDNRIIAYCNYLKKRDKDKPTILVSSDRMMRVHAAMAGVQVESYKNEQVDASGYTGHRDVHADAAYITELFKKKVMTTLPDDGGHPFYENEFVTLHDGGMCALSVHQGGRLILIPDQKMYGDFVPKNRMQTYALWALNNEEIPLVILLGAAGTAKTFLSLSSGLDQTMVDQRRRNGRYNRILISRPNTQANDASFGYLPGDLEEKMEPLLLPFTDNLFMLLSGNGEQKEDRDQVQMQIDDLFESGVIEICALSYIRGRSLSQAYIICDEAQNSSRTLIRDVITRVGHGSKLVLAGDPGQLDAPHLDSRNNGLVFAKESMKGSPLCAIVSFDAENSVRSELAKAAAIRMTLS